MVLYKIHAITASVQATGVRQEEDGQKEGKKIAQSFDWAIFGENGRCERIRTSDPLHPMQMRYLAALHTDGVSSADGKGV